MELQSLFDDYSNKSKLEKYINFLISVLQKEFYEYNPTVTELNVNKYDFYDFAMDIEKENSDIRRLYFKIRTIVSSSDISRANRQSTNEQFIFVNIEKDSNKNVFVREQKDYNNRLLNEIVIEDFFNLASNHFFWSYSIIENLIRKYDVDYHIYVNQKTSLDEESFNKYSQISVNILQKKMHAKRRKFTFVIGAGVSMEYGMMSWSDLIAKYVAAITNKNFSNYDYVFEKIGNSPQIKAQYIVDNLHDGANLSTKEYKFCQTLKNDFYKTAFCAIKPSTLFSVVNCLIKYLDNNNGVITYNYDDLLEQMITHETTLDYQTIYQDSELNKCDVYIYHVHGFLPRKGRLLKDHSNSIILSEQKYNYLFNNPLSWQVACQLTRFRENFCIFVGLSISDPSLRRLLENVKNNNPTKYHYAIISKHSRKGKPSVTDLLAVTKHFERLGVRVIWADNLSDIPLIIDSL